MYNDGYLNNSIQDELLYRAAEIEQTFAELAEQQQTQPQNLTPGTTLSFNPITGVFDIPYTLPLSIGNGGTGASNAATARTNLGLGDMAIRNAVAAVADLAGGISNPPTQAEVHGIYNKVNELLAAMRTASHLTP